MALHKIFFTSLMLSVFVLGANKGFADKLKDIIKDQGISEKWEVAKKFSTHLGEHWEVTDFPKAKHQGKDRYYLLPRQAENPFDCVILSQWGAPHTKLGEVLDNWIREGFSSHLIVTRGQEPNPPTVVQWIDPKVSKAQMAEKWNAHSAEILIETDSQRNVNSAQRETLSKICDYLNTLPATSITRLGSHGEARDSGIEGTINNIEEVRAQLHLRPLSAAAR